MATRKANTSRTKNTSPTKTVKSPVKVVKTSSVQTRKNTLAGASISERMAKAPIAALFAEGIGAFMLAAVYITTQGQPIFLLFALAAIVLTVGHLSGAHVNPAITFGAWVTRKVTTLRALGYIAFQVFGAMLALVVLSYLVGGTPGQVDPMTGQPQDAAIFKATQVMKDKEWFAFFASLLGMSIFAFAFASALRERKEHFAAAFTIGGGLFVALIIAGAGTIINPAVALALQAFSGLKGSDALSWAMTIQVGAPLLGSAIGFFLYDLFRRDIDGSVK